MFKEPICRPGAQWPSPELNLIALVDKSDILRVICDDLLDVHGLQFRYWGEILYWIESVADAKLALHVETTRVN